MTVDLCTRTTPRCTGACKYEVELRQCCRGHVRELMRALAPLLDSVRATWWADYGTLLGAVRNPLTTWADYPWLSQEDRNTRGPKPGIIPHDKDADLGVLFSDWHKVRRLRVHLERAGYTARLNVVAGSMKVRLSDTNHTNVDLFFWRERVDGMLYRSMYVEHLDRFKGRDFPRKMLQPLSTVTWEGMKLPAPRDPRAFLAMRYGPEWMTPIMANHDGVER